MPKRSVKGIRGRQELSPRQSTPRLSRRGSARGTRRTGTKTSGPTTGRCRSPRCLQTPPRRACTPGPSRMPRGPPGRSRDSAGPGEPEPASAQGRRGQRSRGWRTSWPIFGWISSSSLSSLPPPAVASQMVLRSAALSVVASEDRSRTNLPPQDRWSASDSCSNSRACDAMLGPVTMKAEGMPSALGGPAFSNDPTCPSAAACPHHSVSAASTNADTWCSVDELESRRMPCGRRQCRPRGHLVRARGHGPGCGRRSGPSSPRTAAAAAARIPASRLR